MMDQAVLLETRQTSAGQTIGIIRLNAPKSLNALSMAMIEPMYAQLKHWAEYDDVVAVWMEAEGDKAFCAGGDVVQLYHGMTASADAATTLATSYFGAEYRLDYLIHTYPKPLIVWGHGIVMGGGLGLMSGASHRVVTESSRIAMPEITIGLYPDVGASWFLNRMPGRCGYFLGLTGAQINAADACFVGLADRCIANDQRQAVFEALCEAVTAVDLADQQVHQVLKDFEAQDTSQWPEAQVQSHFDVIQSLTDAANDERLIEQLLSYDGDDPWLSRAAQTLAAGSPSSMRLIIDQLRRSRHLSLAQVFQEELVVSVQSCLKGEFAEGVRALLVDKDKKPQWQYPTAESVPSAWIDDFHRLPWGDQRHPLSDLQTC
ncbi:enoyl-CoA hydratase [Terasakiispira papahanaumokuakeensis]|uniref:3-hydroxyisobutyryl-CoA hydrolase n=2 Tax=Terasakiispira papahanaumokuakeensis TaxID=197479 RepID=A0A1E2VF10_9GAMM|nr:enoyl-CoA hydratase [Terasakiispira papahanaumokuakeensis]